MTKLGLIIEQHAQEFGTQERKVSEYLLGNEARILDLSVADIANICQVSQATVVRFCKTLGFKGLKDFKVSYQTGQYKRSEYCLPITWNDTDKEIFNKVFYKTISTLQTSFQSTTHEMLELIADRIFAAHHIDVYGLGGSAIVAQFYRNELMRLGKRVNAYTDPYAMHNSSSMFSERDLIITVSCSGETKEIIAIAEKAKSHHTPVVTITNHADSTLAHIADYLVVTSEEHYFGDEMNTFSRIAQISLISTLYLMVAIRLGSENHEFKETYIERTNYKKFT